jgi:hypothetical protein
MASYLYNTTNLNNTKKFVSPSSSVSKSLENYNNEDITSDELDNSLRNAVPNDSLVNTFMALLENIINTKEECASHKNVMKAIQSALKGDNEFKKYIAECIMFLIRSKKVNLEQLVTTNFTRLRQVCYYEYTVKNSKKINEYKTKTNNLMKELDINFQMTSDKYDNKINQKLIQLKKYCDYIINNGKFLNLNEPDQLYVQLRNEIDNFINQNKSVQIPEKDDKILIKDIIHGYENPDFLSQPNYGDPTKPLLGGNKKLRKTRKRRKTQRNKKKN